MTPKMTPKVLIVDDEPALRELLVDALSDGQLIVQSAGSGREAIEVASADRPDIVITDLCLGDCSGLDVIDHLRKTLGDLPAVVITGRGDADSLSEASRRRPVELMTKPLNLERLREAIREELARRSGQLAEQDILRQTCSDLTRAYRGLADQVQAHQAVIRYQSDLIGARSDDDVFRAFFRTFVRNSGPVSGVAMVCDSHAELRVTGRFGVPKPDCLEFCRSLSGPLIDILLASPHVQIVHPDQELDLYDTAIQRYLPGVTVLAVPLIPAPGEMIGMVVLYRKGEQPFTDDDVEIAHMIAHPTALAIRRND